MKKLFVLAAAAGLLMGVASCAKDGNDAVKGGGQSDGQALMGLSFTLPQGDFTRGPVGTQPGNAIESVIDNIQVWIFQGGQAVSGIEGADANGGGFYNIDVDITPTGNFTASGSTYTLKDAESLLTASGDVTIYVAANTHPSDAILYTTPAQLIAAVGTVAELTNVVSPDPDATALTMFSEATTKTLAVELDDDPATVNPANKVTVTLDRVVSKVQATWKSTEPDDFQSTWTAGPTLSYAVTGFNVHQDATSSYLVMHGNTLSDPIDKTVKASTIPVHDDEDALSEGLGNLPDGFYLAENKSSLLDATAGLSRKGNTTFAMIGTTVTLDKVATWNATTEKVEWATAPAANTENDIVVINATKAGSTYVLLTIDNLDNNGDFTGTSNDGTSTKTLITALEANGYIDVTTTVFWDGYVHFQKWLNRVGTNDYNIGRNEFIHINITGIAELDGVFPGFPGSGDNDDDPKTPIDPVPTEKEPEPVDPLPAELIVEVTVNPWVYKANNTVLGE